MQLCLTLFLFIISECAHSFLREEFSPKTGLAIRHSLNDLGRSTDGFRSKTSSFELTWTVLDLQRTPPRERCCYECNPELLAPFAPANKHDLRLSRFSHHFQYGLAPPVGRPGSSASTQTNTSTASSFTAARRGVKVPKEEQDKLRERLRAWRSEKHRQRGSPIFLSAQVILPPKQLDAFVTHSARFLQEQILTTRLLRKLVPWDSATESDLEELLATINDWRESAAIVIPTTPTSQRRARKKTRADQPTHLTTPQPARPVIQPNFTSRLTPRPMPPAVQPTFTSRFRLPQPHLSEQPTTQTNRFADENVFQTPRPPMQSYHPYIPGPSSYAAAVSSPLAPSTLHTPYNPYQHFLTPMHARPHHYSPFASSGLSQTPNSSTPMHQRPPVSYQFTPNYTPSNYTTQFHK